jgi:putative hydrolase of the HAD superfamily
VLAGIEGASPGVKNLILDFGNVIAFFDHRRASRQLASLAGGEVTENAVFQAVFCTALEADFDCGKISAPEFVQRLRTLFRLAAPDEAIISAWCDMFWPNEEVVSLLPRLKESAAKLLLASNTNQLHYQWFTMRFAVPLALFDGFILSHRIGFRKPSLEFFKKCLEAAGAPPDDCVYVDDRPDFVEVARGIGLGGIVYTPGLDLTQALRTEGVEIV